MLYLRDGYEEGFLSLVKENGAGTRTPETNEQGDSRDSPSTAFARCSLTGGQRRHESTHATNSSAWGKLRVDRGCGSLPL